MEYSREQKQALRNIDITLVYERFGLDNTGDKRIKNAVDILVFIKGVPFAEAIPMLAKAFPEALEGPLPVLPPAKEKKTKTEAPEKENLTLIAQERFFAGVACSKYDILLVPQDENRHIQEFLGKKQEKILDHKFQYFLRQANKAGDAVYIRPAREIKHGYVFIDDIDGCIIDEMKEDGHIFAATLETSPKNFQGWMDAGIPLNEQERQAIQRYLANQYGGDQGSTSGEHFGRLPGFLNTKFEHFEKGGPGRYPWVMVRDSSGAVDPAMAPLLIMDEVMNIREARSLVSIGDIPVEAPETAMEAYRMAQQRLSLAGKIDNSAMDFAICRVMWDDGYSQEIIAGVLLQALKEDGRDRKHPGEDYVRRTVSRALADKMPPPSETQDEESPEM